MSSSPHKCPICEGKGEVTRKLAQVGSVVVQQKPLLFRCHGCQGQGLIWDPAPSFTFPTIDLNPPINNQPFWTNNNNCPGIVNPDNQIVINGGDLSYDSLVVDAADCMISAVDLATQEQEKGDAKS